MDAPLVRSFLDALPDDGPDPRAIPRVRAALASVQGPDVRYLIATVLGPGAGDVARVMASVLEAAGAPTGTLGRSLAQTTLSGAALDDALFGAAGTHAASAVYQLHQTQPALGEVGRREATVLLGLIAFAQAGRRVALLLDEDVAASDPAHAPAPDLAVITRAPEAVLDRATRLVPHGRPAVAARLDGAGRDALESWERRSGSSLLLGGRDHEVREEAGRLVFAVRGDPYITFDPLPHVGPEEVGCALAAVLALGAMGIRMREDWLIRGLDALRGRDRVAT